jgi:hypothetical protein
MSLIEREDHYVCPQCGCADMRETAKVEQLREDLAHYKLGPGVVPADRLWGAVSDRDRWRDCARKLYAQWQAGERPPSESALGRIGFQMREPERGQ